MSPQPHSPEHRFPDESSPLLPATDDRNASTGSKKESPTWRHLFLPETTRIMVLGALCTASLNSLSGYQAITNRNFVCAWYYSALDPQDPAQQGPHPCRQPQIETTLAKFQATVEPLSGVITAVMLLFYSKYMRRAGLKSLILFTMAADLLFMKLPFYILPLGRPLGTTDPWLSPSMAMVLIAVSKVADAVAGGIVLASFALKTMICDITPPSELGRILSRFFVMLFISVSLGPMFIIAFTHWADLTWGQDVWSVRPGHPVHEPAAPAPKLPLPDEEGSAHQPHAYLAGIVLDIFVLLWCTFLIRNTQPAQTSSEATRTTSTAHTGAAGDASVQQLKLSPLVRIRQGASALLKPLTVFLPTRLADTPDNGHVFSWAHFDWTFTRIGFSNASCVVFSLMGQIIFDYLSFQFGLSGEDLSLSISLMCGFTSVLVLFGVPALYRGLENRMSRPIELRSMSRTELLRLGDDITALEDTGNSHEGARDGTVGEGQPNSASSSGPLTEDQHALHRSFSLWRMHIEFECGRVILILGTAPWFLIGLTLAMLGIRNSATGPILLGLCMFSGISMNPQAPLDAAAIALIRAKGATTAQRDEYVTGVAFVHQCMLFIAPLFGQMLYAATVTTNPALLYFVSAVGLTLGIIAIPRRVRI